MSTRYASRTTVSIERSLGELRGILTRYCAEEQGIFTGTASGGVMFTLEGRRIKIAITVPTRDETCIDAAGRKMRFNQSRYDKAVRQRWRALVLVVKAKLEAIASHIETVDQAFMPYLLLPDGKTTLGDAVLGQIESGILPLLGGGK